MATAPVAPWVRVGIMLAAVAAIAGLSRWFTGSLLPTAPEDAVVFQGALLLVVLGSALIEDKFPRPAGASVNSLMATVSLLTVYTTGAGPMWWLVFAYGALVFALATACTAVSEGPAVSGWRQAVARFTYRPSVELGAARRIFSIVFMYAVFSFYGTGSPRTAALVVFWGVFVVLWPLGLPALVTTLFRADGGLVPAGTVTRTEWPHLLRVALPEGSSWRRDQPVVYRQADGATRWVLPLYAQVQNRQLLGTGLCAEHVETDSPALQSGSVYRPEDIAGVSVPTLAEILGEAGDSKLLGFVVEESGVAAIRFETLEADSCSEGMLVWCRMAGAQVFFQITGGVTKEESLETDRHGFQVAVAAQLGVLDSDVGFRKYEWLPAMNTPVFGESTEFVGSTKTIKDGDFTYGHVPKSKLVVGGALEDAFDHHMAILGVTGSGKTELAFDLIRHAIAKGTKVICIDLTAQYRPRLEAVKYRDLSIEAKTAEELSVKLFDVETGDYKGAKEKKPLQEFSATLRAQVSGTIKEFLESTDEDSHLGIIELNEISNTKATLHITELYLTCLLNYARSADGSCPKVLVVVEEAHTVMPEPSTMGLGDFDSKGLVGKIAQIALQGRKYGVGLLVLAQRTATVSKTVLTQCNTMISFACIDDTSLNFLRNVFGDTHVRLIPNLPRLHAVAFGKGVRSERPIVVQIPYDPAKAGEAGEVQA